MSSNARIKASGDLRSVLTTSRPVTFTISDATDGEEGCASRVVTLCSTFWKGNDCVAKDENRIGVRHAVRSKGETIFTVSFSIIAFTPWIGAPSNVSIDVSR